MRRNDARRARSTSEHRCSEVEVHAQERSEQLDVGGERRPTVVLLEIDVAVPEPDHGRGAGHEAPLHAPEEVVGELRLAVGDVEASDHLLPLPLVSLAPSGYSHTPGTTRGSGSAERHAQRHPARSSGLWTTG